MSNHKHKLTYVGDNLFTCKGCNSYFIVEEAGQIFKKSSFKEVVFEGLD